MKDSSESPKQAKVSQSGVPGPHGGESPAKPTPTEWGNGKWHQYIYACCVALFMVPLFLSTHPPMVDLPQHAAQVAMLGSFDSSPHNYNEHFVLNWATPYLVGYLLSWALSQIVPITWAFKLLIATSLGAYAWVGDSMNRSLGGRAIWSYTLLPGLYSFVFYWGFLNFLVGTPFLLAFVWLVYRYSEKPTLKLGIFTALASVALLPFHLLLAAFGGVVGLGIVLLSSPNPRAACLRAVPLLASAPPALLWLLWTQKAEAQTGQPTLLGYGWSRLADALAYIVPFELSWTGLGLGLIMLVLPFSAGAQLRAEVRRCWPLLVTILVVLFFPTFVFGTRLVAGRFTLFFPAFLLLALKPARAFLSNATQRAITLAVLILSLALHSEYFQSFEKESEIVRAMLPSIPPGKRIANLAFNPYIAGRPFPTLTHYGQWYVAEQGGFVDFSFASFFPELVRFPADRETTFPREIAGAPLSFDYQIQKGSQYDYFLVRSHLNPGPRLFHQAKEEWVNVARGQDWWLFKQAGR